MVAWHALSATKSRGWSTVDAMRNSSADSAVSTQRMSAESATATIWKSLARSRRSVQPATLQKFRVLGASGNQRLRGSSGSAPCARRIPLCMKECASPPLSAHLRWLSTLWENSMGAASHRFPAWVVSRVTVKTMAPNASAKIGATAVTAHGELEGPISASVARTTCTFPTANASPWRSAHTRV